MAPTRWRTTLPVTHADGVLRDVDSIKSIVQCPGHEMRTAVKCDGATGDGRRRALCACSIQNAKSTNALAVIGTMFLWNVRRSVATLHIIPQLENLKTERWGWVSPTPACALSPNPAACSPQCLQAPPMFLWISWGTMADAPCFPSHTFPVIPIPTHTNRLDPTATILHGTLHLAPSLIRQHLQLEGTLC